MNGILILTDFLATRQNRADQTPLNRWGKSELYLKQRGLKPVT